MLADAPNYTDPVVRRVFHEIETELGFGMVPNIFKSMAESPSALAAHWAMFKHTILEGQLPRIVKEMVGVVVSSVNRSEYARKAVAPVRRTRIICRWLRATEPVRRDRGYTD